MMRDPTGDWERGRREHRRRSIVIFAALVSAVLSITVAMAILAVAVGKLRVFGSNDTLGFAELQFYPLIE